MHSKHYELAIIIAVVIREVANLIFGHFIFFCELLVNFVFAHLTIIFPVALWVFFMYFNISHLPIMLQIFFLNVKLSPFFIEQNF